MKRNVVLCKDLRLSIEKLENPLGQEQIKIKLEDPLKFLETETCYEVNITSPQSHRYHLLETMVIAMRRVVDQAVKEGMIDLMPLKSHRLGVSTSLSIIDDLLGNEEFPTGSTTGPGA